MKNLYKILFIAILSMAAFACGPGGTASPETQLADAEEAYEIGHYTTAQQLADSLIASPRFESLEAMQLCRLSLLFVKLADQNFPETNTSMAARALDAAIKADSMATNDFIYNQLPPEQRPSLALVAAIVEARNNPACIDDSSFIPTDSIDEEHR